LEAAGIQVDKRGFIPVNERLETSVPGIYALGDINGGPAFTHISYDDFRIIRTNLLEGGNATTTGRLLPYAVFIDPQLGRVGLSEREARAQGRNIRVAKMPMTWVARVLEVDETRGFLKAIVDADTDQILGAAILGIEGGEIMTVLQMAMMGQVPYTVIRDAVFAHPTLAESLNNLFIRGLDLGYHMIDFGREVCGNLALSAGREWLVTNGIGGYASGTMAGLLTRRYHGLLIAALKPPLGRTLLLTKLDETAAYDGRLYPLFANRWASGLIDPAGFHHLERFHWSTIVTTTAARAPTAGG